MGTVPPVKLKSQQLHNFSLPDLRWAHKSIHNSSSSDHRFFPLRDSPSPTPSRSDDACAQETDNNNCNSSAAKTGLRTTRNHHRSFAFSPCSIRNTQSGGVSLKTEKVDNGAPPDKKKDTCGDGEVKPWNLRPRKLMNFLNETPSYGDAERGVRNCITATTSIKNNNDTSITRSMRLRGGTEGSGQGHSMGFERKVVEKSKLWISLSREEIEEDVYALTGSRPSRRPKKRPKTIQKELDDIFPGLYLVGATADSYRVHEK